MKLSITKITNDEEYQEALSQIDENFFLDLDHPLGPYIDNLVDMVIEYEELICPEATMFKYDKREG